MSELEEKEIANLKRCYNELKNVLDTLSQSLNWPKVPPGTPLKEGVKILWSGPFEGMTERLRLIQSLMGYSEIDPQRLKIREEIIGNLQSFTRDGNEHIYLARLNELVGLWRNAPYSDWRNNVKILLTAYPTDTTIPYWGVPGGRFELGIEVRNLLRRGAAIWKEFLSISDWIALETRKSLFVAQHPDRFPHLVSPAPTSTKQEMEPIEPGLKLKWRSNPTITGYLISELIRAGYIEPPTTNGELSYAKLAGICNQIFEIDSKGKPATLDYLKKVVNPESNQLPDYKRAKLNLPDLDQLI